MQGLTFATPFFSHQQDGVPAEADEHGFVHPAAMAAMDPNSEEYKNAYKAFESEMGAGRGCAILLEPVEIPQKH